MKKILLCTINLFSVDDSVGLLPGEVPTNVNSTETQGRKRRSFISPAKRRPCSHPPAPWETFSSPKGKWGTGQTRLGPTRPCSPAARAPSLLPTFGKSQTFLSIAELSKHPQNVSCILGFCLHRDALGRSMILWLVKNFLVSSSFPPEIK